MYVKDIFFSLVWEIQNEFSSKYTDVTYVCYVQYQINRGQIYVSKMSFCKIACTIATVILSVCVYFVHNLPPYISYECAALEKNCPIAASLHRIKSDDKNVLQFETILNSWIANGYLTGSQASIFVNNEEIINFYAKDKIK